MKLVTYIGVLLMILTMAPLAGEAAPFNTGVDDNGNLLSNFFHDPHYQLIAAPPLMPLGNIGVIGDGIIPNWLDSTESEWLSVAINIVPDFVSPAGAPGEYLFRTTFNIPVYIDLAAYSLAGRWTTDNEAVGISLNSGAFLFGNPNPQAFEEWTPFEFTGGFVHGLNILDFKLINDDNGFPGNPVGIRVEFVPEPASIVFVAFGLIGLWLGARWRTSPTKR